jgi:bifunctional ADP-heptose synthase (sugar kinase/adenylyltransferase)
LSPIDPSRARALLERCKGARVLVVGDLMLDRHIVGAVERISPEAPVPVVLVQ